jgi:hypothetical protein
MEILRQKNPNLAEFIDQWKSKYANRVFDLENNVADQADFAEGMMEMARHMASGMKSADLSLTVCNDGVAGLEVSGSPKN